MAKWEAWQQELLSRQPLVPLPPHLQAGAAAASGRQGRRGAKASPEDAIETQTQEPGAEEGTAEDKAGVSPTPSWMHDADAGQVRGGCLGLVWELGIACQLDRCWVVAGVLEHTMRQCLIGKC